MSGLEWSVVVLLVLLALGAVVALLWWLRRRSQREMVRREMHWMAKYDDSQRTLMDFSAHVKAALPASPRYEVRLADWGPDFTGYDGTLPRWRWSVVDADLALRDALGTLAEDEVGTVETPHMLGNDFSAGGALMAAVRWIEERQNPPLSVVIDRINRDVERAVSL